MTLWEDIKKKVYGLGLGFKPPPGTGLGTGFTPTYTGVPMGPSPWPDVVAGKGMTTEELPPRTLPGITQESALAGKDPGPVRGPGKIMRDEATGKVTGVELPSGKTFFGIDEVEARALLERELGKPLSPDEAAQIQGWLEELGAFEEVTPGEVPLSPELGTDIPILTPTLGAASQFAPPRSLLGIARDNGWLGDVLPEVRTGEEAFPMLESEETLREASLRQISINSFNEDTTNAEKFGAFMELIPFGMIPIVGKSMQEWVRGVVESPYPNAEAVLAEIRKMGNTATNLQEKTRSGIMPAADAMDRARDMEERLAWLEGRLKLLINQSKILQANTDKVNEMMQEILDMKTRTDNFRTSAAFALAGQLSGKGRIIPADEQIYFELKEANEKS